ncbi:MAG TPA: hypothetical protein VNS19_04185 [Acidimicrobiales bacterium]|jgi:hypothetical protein|nr:hypothetical protein [Acidimicrobiales bacterium]
MFATFFAKFGRRIVMWAVVAVASALARKALDHWAGEGEPIETTGAAAS